MPTFTLTKDLAVSITQTLPIGVLLTTTVGDIVFANPKAESIFGYEKNTLPGQSIEILIPEKFRISHRAMMKAYAENPTDIAMSGGRNLSGVKKNGETFALQIGLSPLNKDYLLVTFIESSNEVLKPSSANDTLTGLPNRKLFDEYSEKLRTLAIRKKSSITIAFIDLDNFKPVNDQFGHKVGDLVICEVARILIQNVRESDFVARVGGDEFLICQYDTGSIENLQTHLMQLVQKISAIHEMHGHPISIGASIGAINTNTPENAKINQMVSLADKLMYQVKRAGKGAVKIESADF